MKVRDSEILIIPGYTNSGPEHWQTRWENKLSTARRIHQADWYAVDPDRWRDTILAGVARAEKPAVLIGHSLGIASIVAAAPHFVGKVAGAFMVAPPDLDDETLEPAELRGFGPYSREPLQFPSVTVASRNDPYCRYDVAEDLAAAWGSVLVDAGEAGHINTEAGFGPWPEGTMVFAQFLSRL